MRNNSAKLKQSIEGAKKKAPHTLFTVNRRTQRLQQLRGRNVRPTMPTSKRKAKAGAKTKRTTGRTLALTAGKRNRAKATAAPEAPPPPAQRPSGNHDGPSEDEVWLRRIALLDQRIAELKSEMSEPGGGGARARREPRPGAGDGQRRAGASSSAPTGTGERHELYWDPDNLPKEPRWTNRADFKFIEAVVGSRNYLWIYDCSKS